MYFFIKLGQSPIINSFGFIIGIAGFVSAIIFYIKAKKDKKPIWTIKTANLIKKGSVNYENLNVKYKDKIVETLSVSRILFFNDGRASICQDDFSKDNPLRIITKGNSIILLDCKIIASNDVNVTINLNRDKNEIPIMFEYLNYQKGAVIEILHSGISSNNINIVGGAKDVKRIEKSFPSSNNHLHKFKLGRKLENKIGLIWASRINYIIQKIESIFCFILGIAMLFIFIIALFSQKHARFYIYSTLFVFLIGGIIYIILGWVLWKRKLPKVLEIFQEEMVD